ncbi:LIC_10190 family membrane protein [Polaribacter sejongensis]|uniref:LIC_10190 family membrane protein n=1 Tax=Polaribacter sejongensis TaxID=985043 RepID=UPI003744A14E
MLLILINWIYIFISSLSFGFLLKKLFKIESQNFTIHHILGLFSITLFSWLYAFFFALDHIFYGIMSSITLFCLYFFRKEIKTQFTQFKKSWLSFSKTYKFGLLFIFIIALAMSSVTPSIFDNESYYLQTIKWLNEYGFVKGLGNLHIFFAQTSSWHILQAAFTFPFLETNFNDLNGFFLIIFSFFCFQQLHQFKTTKKIHQLYIGSVLVGLPFIIFFINAPSPDLPVFLISQLLFYLFIKHFNKIDYSNFILILLLTIFLCVIKITTCVLVLLPLILFVKHYKILKSNLVKPIVFSIFVVGLFLMKNVILTGYLLYPLQILDVLNVDWKVPTALIQLFKVGTYSAAFDYQELANLSTYQLFIAWITSFKFNGIINMIFMSLLIYFPFLWYFKSKEKSVFILYVIGVLHFVLAWIFSPQYRFFFFYMLFFAMQICVWFFRKEKIIVFFMAVSLLLSLVPFLTELKLSNYTTIKKTNTKTSLLKLENILQPNVNSSMSGDFEQQIENGFHYNSPTKESYFWTVGIVPLPAVNVKQISFIKKHYKIIPSLITEDIGDGFKSLVSE